VERKSKDDPIFDERKVKNNDIDYRLPIDSFNLGNGQACLAHEVSVAVTQRTRDLRVCGYTSSCAHMCKKCVFVTDIRWVLLKNACLLHCRGHTVLKSFYELQSNCYNNDSDWFCCSDEIL